MKADFTAFVLCICLMLSAVRPSLAMFDLYIPKSAMQQVIKTFKDSKVYYVYNGTINRYALKFKIPIPMDVDKLHFCWINRSKKKMPYSIGFTVSNQLAMDTPLLNISSRGYVPHEVSGFEVTLPCTGVTQSDVTFGIQLNVTIENAGLTSLSIKRSKVCTKRSQEQRRRQQQQQLLEGADSTEGSLGATQKSDSATEGETLKKFSTKAVAILAGASALSLALIGGLVAVYFCRTRQAANCGKATGASSSTAQPLHVTSAGGSNALATVASGGYVRGGGGAQVYPPFQPQLGNYSKVETCSQTSGYTSCSLPSHKRPGGGSPTMDNRRNICEAARDLMRDLRIPWERITLKCILMEGSYGRIYRGSMVKVTGNEQEEVLIKTVSDFARPDQVNEFLEQAAVMCDLQHHNLNVVLASSQIPGDPRPHLIYAYPTEGNLKLYLIRCRSAQTTSVYCVLSTQQLINMAIQIAKGLHHLHRKRLVHGDVACRNCVLTGDYNVKLCDSALSKDLFPDDYQCLHGYDSRPLKWMPPEALVDGKCTAAADTWSFGVTLWELITRCLQPYSEIDPAQMPKCLMDGHQLVKPANCPDQLFTIMSSCWKLDQDQRPRISQIQGAINDFNDALRTYV